MKLYKKHLDLDNGENFDSRLASRNFVPDECLVFRTGGHPEIVASAGSGFDQTRGQNCLCDL